MHPFDPLEPSEIAQAANITRPHFGDGKAQFRVITLQEPPKKQMIEYLESEHDERPKKSIPRCARVEVVLQNQAGGNELFDLLIDLDQSKVIAKQLQRGKHSYIDAAYMKSVEAACLADPEVQVEIQALDLPVGASVIVEPWAYATDGANDMSQRITMCWFYLRLYPSEDTNYYAYPLDLCAEVSEQLEVTKIYRLPTTPNGQINHEPRPFDRRRIHATAESEYHPDLRPKPRTTTKPLQIIQPDGPSFHVQGNLLWWEKWSFRVGFNYREGMTLHDIRYDGQSLFYRLSLAEMFVPYGDPRAPYPRKGAFDLGNDGAGINANNLQLGCDCLGTIKYFDAWHNTDSGEPLKLPNVICCHEQDDGILWKHTNFRTQNAVVMRSRILVLQTVITVSNYEYIFAFHFTQDASIFFEVRATGILSTVPADVEVKDKYPYGTTVAPGVLAPFHQHLFSLRIDPAIKGHANSFVIEETRPMPMDDSMAPNPYGVGFLNEEHIVTEEGGFDLDFTKNRIFKFVNENDINTVTNTPIGFKLLPSYSQLLLAHPESYHAKRSEFGQHAVWVTRYEDNDHFPSGRYTMQSAGGEGIASGIRSRKEAGLAQTVRNTDIVIWHTFGSTHNPRVEDWPVMPSEKMVVGLKPVNFFTGNPGLDLAVSTQEKNQSAMYKARVGTNNSCCSSD